MKRVLLIDADILCYHVAAINEEKVDFGDGQGEFYKLSPLKISQDIEQIIQRWMAETKVKDYRVCLSDPKKNWRKSLDPTYKQGRLHVRKPALLNDTKHFMYQTYATSVTPWLEADDVMGILATNPKRKVEYVIVSEDKDMRTIAGLVYHPHRPENGIMRITTLQANQFLMWQTLCGDQTDEYPGCPGIGKSSVYAQDVLELTKPLDLWNCVIDGYASKGFTEKHAVHQARLACIAKHWNWDNETKRIKLWNPTHLFY